jgi:enhancing lycopene biosynthesis protein 2
MKKAAMVLSGCGYLDGSGIHEATLLLLACDQFGIDVDGFAPSVNQVQVINHINHVKDSEVRNVLKESARIMRGNVRLLSDFSSREYSLLLFPGGYGAVQNLSNFGVHQTESYEVHADVERAVLAMSKENKPMCFMCISPMIAGKVLSQNHLRLTIGNDLKLNAILRSQGATVVNTEPGQIVWDDHHRIGSSPAYNIRTSIRHVYLEACELLKRAIQHV